MPEPRLYEPEINVGHHHQQYHHHHGVRCAITNIINMILVLLLVEVVVVEVILWTIVKDQDNRQYFFGLFTWVVSIRRGVRSVS